MTDPMVKISDIAGKIPAEVYGDGSTVVTDVTHDSRQAKEGTLFAAIKGHTMDGHRFVDDVMRRGAAGIISEQEPPAGFNGVWLKVEDTRAGLAATATLVHGDPSKELKLVAVTGTNGKTTTTYLVFALAEAGGEKCAMLTTVEYRTDKVSEPAVRTTPESPDTQRFLRNAVTVGCQTAVMETSSQAIHLRRCDWLKFNVAIFTNLTRDHLDYHHTMEEYFDAKKMLFDGRLGETPDLSAINIDDEWGVRLAKELSERGNRIVTFGQDSDADLTAEIKEVSLVRGTTFLLKTPAGERIITSPLVGKPHVYNMLSATAAGLELGYDLDTIQNAFETCVGAPGRFERVRFDADFAVVVDYAHSDDALDNTLKTARELAKARIITVFGCGGDRDKSKRAPMGAAAGKYSDLVIITSDNPRSEDPNAIIEEVEVGVKSSGCEYFVNPDRREAIHQAIAAAQREDVVIIAGKGHETYQLIGGESYHFDDREIALEALENLNE
ncbi:MAG: UDP-N-acetylmuramoyl-L-alanyl-D-glutamate--2,6-diaminopimelate ligase [Pyrinomonadaceae bacterium]